MTRVLISVEGKSERVFVEKILKPHLAKKFKVYTQVQDMKGNIRVDRVVKKLNALIHNFDYVTTLYDFYGFRRKSEDETKQSLEEKITQGIKDTQQQKIIPYIQMYEFEALLFSNAKIMADNLKTSPDWIENILEDFNSNPENINNSKETAPSKRIEKKTLYRKTTHAPEILKSIGLKEIREKCQGFNDWLSRLESLDK